jgi:hypothetical protein
VTAGTPSNPAKVTAGSTRSRATAAAHHDAVVAKLEDGLSAQRIWQDLVEEEGFGGSYEAVKRYVRRVRERHRLVGVFHHSPGDEAQVDFFRGPKT